MIQSPASWTTMLMMVDARPVTVMQARDEAGHGAGGRATGMVLLAPAAKASAMVSSAIFTVSTKTEPKEAPLFALRTSWWSGS